MILGTFIHQQLNIYGFIVVFIDSVAENLCVTIAFLLVFGEYIFLVCFIKVFHKLFRTEYIPDLSLLVGFFHRPLQLIVGKRFVSFYLDAVDLELFFFIYIYLQYNLVFLGAVGSLKDAYFGITKTLLLKEAFDDCLCPVDLRRCNLIPFYKADLLLNIFLLAFFHAQVANVGNAGTVGEFDLKPDAVAFDPLLQYLYIRKQTLFPETLQCVGNILAGDLYLLPLRQSRKANKDKFLIFIHGPFHSCDIDIGNDIFFWRGSVVDAEFTRNRSTHTVVGLCQ